MTKIEILNKYKKQKHNTYRECDVINAMEKYLESYKQAKALQLQQTGVSGSTFIAISKETGKGYFFEYSDMSLWENDDSVDIYEVKYYR